MALVVVFLYWLLVFKSRVRLSPARIRRQRRAASTAGVNPGRMIVTAMLISGAVAGLVGMTDLLGDSHAYRRGLTEGYGFDGIAVALLGRNHPSASWSRRCCSASSTTAQGSCRSMRSRRSIVDIIKAVIRAHGRDRQRGGEPLAQPAHPTGRGTNDQRLEVGAAA